MKKVKLLIAEDLKFFQKIYQDIFSNSNFEILKICNNGEEVLSALKKGLNPDVILLDIEMPVLDGYSTLKLLTKNYPHIPVIIVSSYTTENAEITLDCYESGAVDVIEKPSEAQFKNSFNLLKEILIKKIFYVYNNYNLLNKQVFKTGIKKYKYIGIGASTGGVLAITQILKDLKKFNNTVIFIIQHMPEKYTASFAKRLSLISNHKVKEAKDRERIKGGNIYVAPGGKNLYINSDGVIYLQNPSIEQIIAPSINETFKSLAKFGDEVAGVILTGMGKDGAIGLKEIKENGGFTIVQDESSSVVFGMGRACLELFPVDEILPLDSIGKFLNKLIN